MIEELDNIELPQAPDFTGSMVALVTPMRDGGAVDWEALARLVDWHVEAGTSAIVSVGTTGESPTLGMAEHAEVIGRTVKLAAGRIQVIAGTGANSTAEAIELTKEACTLGADACLSVVPYYNKPTQEGLFEHFIQVAESSDKPVILYNVPARTVADLEDATVVELMQHPVITGIKDATGELARLAAHNKDNIRKEFAFLSGDDASCREYMLAGGHGVISVTANVAPAMMAAMVAAATAGDAAAAAAADEPLAAFHQAQGVVANPIPVKWALADLGRIPSDTMRLPLTMLPYEHHELVRAAAAGLK